MIDVLLTHSYHLYFDRKQALRLQPYPPLATLYAASLLRSHGVSVAVFDTMLRPPSEFKDVVRDLQPRIVAVYEDDFNYLSKMCLSRMREVCWEVLEYGKSAGALVVTHGSDATDNASEYLDKGFDAVLVGEAEPTLLEIALQKSIDEHVPGLAIRESNGTVRHTESRRLRRALDWLPFPARDLVEMSGYRTRWMEKHGRFSTNMISSRGCPFQCNWCAKPIFGDRFQLRPEKDVAAEMEHLQQLYGVNHIWFADDVFALDRHWVLRFAEEVCRRACRVPFKIQSRADLMIDQTVDALASSGCEEVWLGVESGSQRVLDAMDKDISVANITEGTRRLRRAGIRPCYFLQLGYPGESWDDIRATIELVRQMRPEEIGVSISYPLPNTRFYEKVRWQLGAKRNWCDSDDLCVMFSASYRDSFYLGVRDALHAEVDSWKHKDDFETKRHVLELWKRVAELEPVCRNERPTFPVDPGETRLVPVTALAPASGGK